ncbi:MAG TPA: hypothetical protein VE398_25145 [Acidobacteriota bacterium]|nr:hypothetical protein [Acidobacteriota bacterium]
MKSTESQQPLFRELAADLPDQHRAEFFRNLHEAGIGSNDVELARLLRALQLYKSYYESIPAAVKDAAGEIDRVKHEIETLVGDARNTSDSAAQLGSQILGETERFRRDLAGIHTRVEGAIGTSAQNLALRMAELLSVAVEQNVLSPLRSQLAELAKSNRGFEDAINRNNQAATSLRRNAVLARRVHLGTLALGGLLVICGLSAGSWLYLEHWYATQLERERAAIVEQVGQNRAVLLQLSKSRRTLELVQDPEHPHRKLLVMKDASGWQSTRNHGVIEFND